MKHIEYKEFLDTNWNANRHRILLFADIMGFKSKVLTSKHTDLVKQFREFKSKLTQLIKPLEIGLHLRLTLFSDSIIMATDSCTIKNFNIITKAAALLMYLCHEYKFPINGCIACGDLTFEEQIQPIEHVTKRKGTRKIEPYMPLFIGKSVVDAYTLNEDLFCYGIVLHQSTENIFNASNRNDNAKFHHPYHYVPVPLKSGGCANLFYLSWIDVPTSTKSVGTTKEDIMKSLEDLEKNSSSRARAYIFNTLEIFNNINDRL